MKTLFVISKSYWSHNRKTLSQLILVLSLTTAGLVCACLYGRSALLAELDDWLNDRGNFDISIYYPDETIDQYLQNDTRYSETSKVYNIGSAVCNGECVDIGYFENDLAIDMFHLKLLKGRYPEKEGELCIDEITLKQLGQAPRLETTLDLQIQGVDGTMLKQGSYTVVGIVQVQIAGIEHTVYGRSNYDGYGQMYYPPLIYLSKEEGEALSSSDSNKYIFLGNVAYTDSFDDWQMLDELTSTFYNIGCWDTLHSFSRSEVVAAITMHDDIIKKTGGYGYLSNERNIENGLLKMDDYNGVLIPIFFIIYVIIAVFSIYSILHLVLSKRQQEITILRSIGMSLTQLISMLLLELLALLIVCLLLGYAAGIGIYAITLWIQSGVFHQPIFWALHLSGFWGHYIRMVTHNPYVIPWMIVLFVAFMVYLFYLAVKLHDSVLEDAPGHRRQRRLHGSLGRSLMGGRNPGLFLLLLFLIISASISYFGSRRLADESESVDTARYKLEKLQTDDYDYIAVLDVGNTLFGHNQILHSGGLSREALHAITEDDSVDSYVAYIANASSKIILSPEDPRNELLQSGNNRFQDLDNFSEEDNLHFRKIDEADWAYKGYTEDDRIYQAPMLGFENDFLQSCASHVIAGAVHPDKIADGQESILVVKNAEYMDYFHVGDVLHLSDVIYDSSIDDNAAVVQGGIVDGMELTTFIDGTAFYGTGKRQDFTTGIGAIILLDDFQKLAPLPNYHFLPDSGVYIITSMDAFSGFGLPDRNVTDLYVALKRKADLSEFEAVWYANVMDAGVMNQFSMEELTNEIFAGEGSSMLIFYALFLLLLLIGGVCIYNIIHVIIYNAAQKIHIVRSIGGTRQDILRAFMGRLLLYPLGTGISGFLLLGIYMLLAKLADQEMIRNFRLITDTDMPKTWYDLLPWIDLVPYHPYWYMLIIAVISILIVGIIGYYLLRSFMKDK